MAASKSHDFDTRCQRRIPSTACSRHDLPQIRYVDNVSPAGSVVLWIEPL